RRDHARTALHARYQRPLDRAALFGGDYNLPIGISPVGLVNALWPGADNMLAAAARAANVPYGLSTVGTTSIEASGANAACRFLEPRAAAMLRPRSRSSPSSIRGRLPHPL
ncbi:MAG: alpha-hydroxy-acid oxidizing protein, partial [Mesorhizobium sp.]